MPKVANVQPKMHQVLPPDVILEILIWTDIESLPRLRWVCKEWRHLLSHPHLINRHRQKSKNICGFILDNTSENEQEARSFYNIHFLPHPSTPLSEPLPSLTFMMEPVMIKASTPQGLLLCFGLINECYYVCKPSTQEWATIPSPEPQDHTLRMVMSVASTSPLRFRIMSISYRRRRYKCEVFDSDSCGVWKTIEIVGALFDGAQSISLTVRDAVVLDGSFWWIEHKGPYEVTKIICFNLWTEELTTLKLPEQMVTKKDWIHRLSNLNGGLGLIRSWNFVLFEFWAVTSMVEQRWENLQVLDASDIDDPLAKMKCGWLREDFIMDNFVILNPLKCQSRFFWFNFREEKFIDINLNAAPEINNLYFFQSDYFPCNIDGCPYNRVGRS